MSEDNEVWFLSGKRWDIKMLTSNINMLKQTKLTERQKGCACCDLLQVVEMYIYYSTNTSFLQI